ncbi:MAG: Rho termination factor N-terminal domain-containing protein, partial [Bacteroidia bacterium]|nr:Rho termination factor N-terminal domain-containing protein [Bacteroidia bacterium]
MVEIEILKEKKISELREIAIALGVDNVNTLKRSELLDAIG